VTTTTPMPDPAVLEVLERAHALGVTLDSDGALLYVVGSVPPWLAPLIESHRSALVALLAEQRRLGATDPWGDPLTADGTGGRGEEDLPTPSPVVDANESLATAAEASEFQGSSATTTNAGSRGAGLAQLARPPRGGGEA